ncbi:hypothetical protein GW17_00021298 [Ensete ventricosum]|nr:hypothetical protein GW17_00021298 [Ensete ventricosum]RZR77895.1 hypothetical protein BHM03_00003103 [Ensete ventricosum]
MRHVAFARSPRSGGSGSSDFFNPCLAWGRLIIIGRVGSADGPRVWLGSVGPGHVPLCYGGGQPNQMGWFGDAPVMPRDGVAASHFSRNPRLKRCVAASTKSLIDASRVGTQREYTKSKPAGARGCQPFSTFFGLRCAVTRSAQITRNV